MEKCVCGGRWKWLRIFDDLVSWWLFRCEIWKFGFQSHQVLFTRNTSIIGFLVCVYCLAVNFYAWTELLEYIFSHCASPPIILMIASILVDEYFVNSQKPNFWWNIEVPLFLLSNSSSVMFSLPIHSRLNLMSCYRTWHVLRLF